MRLIRLLFFFSSAVLIAAESRAQKGLNSIYSAYGIGDYRMRDQNAFLGMGNTGVALPSEYSINEINPSSFAWLPKNNLRLELTLGGLSTKYVNENTNTSAGDFTFSRVALSAQLVDPIRTVIGLRRFSQVEYYTTSFRDIAGTNDKISSAVEGNGGLYQFYIGNALKLGKNLAFGVNTGFIFGSVNTKETMNLSEAESLIIENNDYYNHGSISAGLQYQLKGKTSKWMFGAFYEPQIRMNQLRENQLKNQDDVVLSEKDAEYDKFVFPQKYGGGVSFTRNSFTATVDVIGHLWSSTGYEGNHFTTTDSYSWSAGIRKQYTKKTVWGEVLGLALQAGYNYENSYLIIDGNNIKAQSFTLGVVIPSSNNMNYYSVGMKIGSRGVAVYPLVKEKFFEFNVNFSLGSIFYKGRKLD